MTPLVDPYAVLGVTPQASQEEINSAYRRLVRLHHPDAGPSAQSSVLQRVLAAYALLRDPRRRAEYDRRHPPSAPAADSASAGRHTSPTTMPPGMMRMTLTIRVRPMRRRDAA